MRAVRALAALALTAVFAAPLPANPMNEKHLMALAEAGLSDDAILRMVEERGLAQPLTPEAVVLLREAGLSAPLVSRLILLAEGNEPIRIEERDGVTVISGRGEPNQIEDEDARESWSERGPEEWPAPPPAEPPALDVVIVNGATPAQASSQDSRTAQGYPAGAVFGVSGGAVFLPARFGGNEPSAFGRTIVGFTGGGVGCCAPYVAPAPVVVAPAPETRMIPVRTSRGTLWIPN